jgi:plastocyanin
MTRAALVMAVMLGLTVVGGCSQRGGSTTTGDQEPGAVADARTEDVVLKSMAFQPATLTIKTGEEVTWKNEDSTTHTASSLAPEGPDTNGWHSGNIEPGQSYTTKLAKPGSYPYQCKIHTQMTGTIVVE